MIHIQCVGCSPSDLQQLCASHCGLSEQRPLATPLSPLAQADLHRNSSQTGLSLSLAFVDLNIDVQQDPKMALGPHIKQRTLADRQLGSWKDIESVSHMAFTIERKRGLAS